MQTGQRDVRGIWARWTSLLEQPVSRRRGLRAGALAVAGLLAGVAAACDGGGGDDEEEDDD